MKGTEKQIKWAEDIKAQVMEAAHMVYEDGVADHKFYQIAFEDTKVGHTAIFAEKYMDDAKFWINTIGYSITNWYKVDESVRLNSSLENIITHMGIKIMDYDCELFDQYWAEEEALKPVRSESKKAWREEYKARKAAKKAAEEQAKEEAAKAEETTETEETENQETETTESTEIKESKGEGWMEKVFGRDWEKTMFATKDDEDVIEERIKKEFMTDELYGDTIVSISVKPISDWYEDDHGYDSRNYEISTVMKVQIGEVEDKSYMGVSLNEDGYIDIYEIDISDDAASEA